MIETKRLILRKMQASDYGDLCKILQDPDVMYAYNGPFSDDEAKEWFFRQQRRYKNDGFGLFAVVLKESGEMIGQCGLSYQPVGNETVLEVGYLFQKAYWHKGFATEAAIAAKEYAFNVLDVKEVYSIIRDTNIPSQNVAKRNGMKIVKTFVKHYRGVDMPHYLFCVKRDA